MSKTIRVSDELYDVIDNYRKKDETFQDVIERMAHEIGLLPSKIKDLDDLRRKLKNLYGYDSGEVARVFDALRIVYTGQEKKGTIGIPHDDVDAEYTDEVDSLQRLGLVEEHHYTGKYDYGYRATGIGNRFGSELVREFIDEHEHEIQNIVDSYDNVEIGYFMNFGFERSEIGHLTTRGASLAVSYEDSLVDDEELQERYAHFRDQLAEIGLAISHSSNSFTVLPEEFDDYLRTKETGQAEAIRRFEVYKTIKKYATEDINTREDLLEHLYSATEADLEKIVSAFHRKGLTSRYLKRDEAPFLIKDKNQLLDELRQEVREAIATTS